MDIFDDFLCVVKLNYLHNLPIKLFTTHKTSRKIHSLLKEGDQGTVR